MLQRRAQRNVQSCSRKSSQLFILLNPTCQFWQTSYGQDARTSALVHVYVTERAKSQLVNIYSSSDIRHENETLAKSWMDRFTSEAIEVERVKKDCALLSERVSQPKVDQKQDWCPRSHRIERRKKEDLGWLCICLIKWSLSPRNAVLITKSGKHECVWLSAGETTYSRKKYTTWSHC